MLKSVKLLDCTLRDGGFVNDWEFGHDDIVHIFERLVSAGIDIIELGFIDDRRNFDINRTIMPDAGAVNTIYMGLKKADSMLVGMIDFGTCALDKICPKEDSIMDGIRVIFKKKDRIEAIEYCRQLQEKGYKMFIQPVSITSYTDEEMLELVSMVNACKPHAMSMVDTYGLLHQGNLLHYFDLIDGNLDASISMGYHSHNNFQLGYSNSMALMERQTKRSLVIDGSVYGMGKGAGNAPLELLAMYMNANLSKNYDISHILEILDVNIMKVYRKAPWGYSLNYYLAASNDCHPSYVQHLMQKRTLSVKSVNEILESIDEKEKLSFNKEHIEHLYISYQKKDINDECVIKELRDRLTSKNILILGPGKSMEKQRDQISSYVAKHKPVIITINYVPEYFYTDYIFLSNAKRYVGLANKLQELDSSVKIIATSNVTKTSGSFDYTVDYSQLVDMNFEIIDSSLLMLLRLLIQCDVRKTALAGFDGYSAREENYFNVSMEYDFVKEYADKLNVYTRESIAQMADKLEVEFITESKYRSNGNE